MNNTQRSIERKRDAIALGRMMKKLEELEPKLLQQRPHSIATRASDIPNSRRRNKLVAG